MEPINWKIMRLAAETPDFYTVGPFMTTSGCLAPIYPDIRKVFTDPNSLQAIAKEIIKLIKKKKISFEMILGGATAGIPVATAVALIMNKPLGYVRTKAKAGGLGRAVEGNWRVGMKVIIIDDAAAHGAGKSQFIKQIRKAGLKIDTVIAVYSRNRQSKKDHVWTKKLNVKLYDLGDIGHILEYAYKHKIVSEEAYTLLAWYREDPHNWNNDPEKWTFFEKYKQMKKRESSSGI